MLLLANINGRFRRFVMAIAVSCSSIFRLSVMNMLLNASASNAKVAYNVIR